MAEGGIRAGDPLIEILTDKLSDYDIQHTITKASGAKKGDGDIYTKNLDVDICFDGKYVIEPKINPKFLVKDLEKIKHQAESIGRIGVIFTNTIDHVYVAIELDDFISLLCSHKVK